MAERCYLLKNRYAETVFIYSIVDDGDSGHRPGGADDGELCRELRPLDGSHAHRPPALGRSAGAYYVGADGPLRHVCRPDAAVLHRASGRDGGAVGDVCRSVDADVCLCGLEPQWALRCGDARTAGTALGRQRAGELRRHDARGRPLQQCRAEA